MSDLISVIVPVYNVEEYIESCIDSVLNQTYQNIEIILVNDGSTDRSQQICDELSDAHPRVRVFHTINKGVSAARNVGLAEAKGDYFTFVDSDDSLPIDALSTLEKVANENKSDCTVGLVKRFCLDTDLSGVSIQRDSTSLAIAMLNSLEASEEMLYQGRINGGPFAKLFRRKSVFGVEFPKSVKYAEDLLYNFLALQKIKKISLVDQVVYNYRDRDGSAMNNFSISRMDGLVMTKRVLDESYKVERLRSAAIARHFLEAILIGKELYDKENYRDEYLKCRDAIISYRSHVMFNNLAPKKHRLFATITCLSPELLFMILDRKAVFRAGVIK